MLPGMYQCRRAFHHYQRVSKDEETGSITSKSFFISCHKTWFMHDLFLGLHIGDAHPLQSWPSRLTSISPRLKELGVSNGHFQKDKVGSSN